MKLLFLCFLLTSDLVPILAVRNVTEQLYCTKHISAYSSSGSQVKEPNRGKYIKATFSCYGVVCYITVLR
ncbi:hypothetical protein EB796_002537 [Bugula neritina]|uniref:Secreted protein n=1 Tax=Bugula neritina TaxID=10212 RepID=A0A7J7KLX2_BUGNE|nr:hypothetical protein EB796_002537 [Bugula neritina]